MKKIFGIDLGTTNSLIGLHENETTKLIPNRKGSIIMPSIVSFMDNGTYVVGHRAKELMISNPDKTIYSAKRFMGKPISSLEGINQTHFKANNDNSYIEVQIDDKSYSIPEISSFILKELKKQAESYLKESVEDVVITVPAYFNDHQRQETKKAGQLASLNVIKIINEPTAAALSYGIDKNNCKIVVYDFGGGTFDVSILHIRNGAFEVLSTNGNTNLGGDDIDQAIVDYLISSNNLSNLNSHQLEALRQLAIEIKHRLSDLDEIHFVKQIGTYEIDILINLDQFNQIIKPIIDKTKRYVRLALRDAGLDYSEIDEIVMVGGSTRIPLVQSSVSEWFAQKPHTDIDPDQVVAIGAAIQGSILAGQITETVLLDVTPLSLGMETMGGVVEKFIMRNSKIPCSITQTFTTAVDNQSSVSIHIVQGEREFAKDNTSLGRFVLTGIAPKPAGHARIDVQFQLDQNGVLQIKAKDQASQAQQHIEIQSNQGLSDKKVEELLLDSIKNAKNDFEERLLTEAVTEAKAILKSTENALSENKHLISLEEEKEINKSVASLKRAIDKSIDRNLIMDLIDNLDEKSQHFAEIIMNSSIQSVLKEKRIDEIG